MLHGKFEIQRCVMLTRNNGYVIGLNRTEGAYTPWVTWWTNGDDSYYFGHYFREGDEAWKDFWERLSKECTRLANE